MSSWKLTFLDFVNQQIIRANIDPDVRGPFNNTD